MVRQVKKQPLRIVKLRPDSDLSKLISEIIAKSCSIKGCIGKWHRDETNEIIDTLISKGYIAGEEL